MTRLKSSSGAFGSECRQALRNPWLYMAMAVALAVMINDSFDPLWRTLTGEYPLMHDSPERYSMTIMFGMIILLAPLLSGFPYASAYANDVTSGMLRMRALRCGRLSDYVSAKYRAAFMSGALTLSVPVAAYIAIVVAVCGGYRYNPANTSPLEQGLFAPLLVWGGAPFFAVQILQAGAFGGLWACVGLAVSAWIVNKYVAVVAPLVIYLGLTYLTQNIGWRVLDPGELMYLLPNFQVDDPLLGIIILTVVPCCELALVYIAFRRGVTRRLENGRI